MHAGLPREVSAGMSLVSVPSANVVCGRYRFIGDLRQLAGEAGTDQHSLWARGPSPLKTASWLEVLAGHPDQEYAAYIRSGIQWGFRVGFVRGSIRLKSCSSNHPSAVAGGEVVKTYLNVECDAGRLVGPLAPTDLQGVHISPIGLVPKSEPNQWRMIVDLSHPRGRSVNDGISSEVASVSYASVDDAVQLVLKLGKGTLLAKLDLKQAYRQVPIHPQDQHLFGICWEGRVYVDRVLPFGLRSAPKIFTAVSDMIAWAFHKWGIEEHIRYFDDFLILGRPGSNAAQNSLEGALQALDYLGVPVSWNKTEGPDIRA